MRVASRSCSRSGLAILLAITALIAPLAVVHAQDEDTPVRPMDSPATKQTQIDLLWQGARARLAAGATAVKSKGKKAKTTGTRVRPAFDTDLDTPRSGGKGSVTLSDIPGFETFAVPVNVPISNRVGDGANAGQAEESMAIVGPYGVCAWNDGQGFIVGPSVQGIGYTTNGGASWTDAGVPPLTPSTGGTITAWTSDPVVVVNEKTGEFWYCGLVNGTASTNGLAAVRVTFPGGVFTYDTVRVIRLAPNATNFLDKQWFAADSSNGMLYASYTNFFAGGDQIDFQRSTNGGRTWSVATMLSSVAAIGLVQASRPATGPNGELYVSWNELGPVDADFVRIRTSLDQGASFGVQNTAAAYMHNFGTGAPGFNRNRAVVEPALVVDRSLATSRGRIYASWHESINWYDAPLGGGGAKNEIENNNFFNRSTAFTPGQRLRGAINTTTDTRDYFSWSATAGTEYVFWVDSIPSMLYTIRIFCTDTTTLLALGGDNSAPAGGNGFIVFTAPTTATYYMRMASVAGSGTTTGYRIQSGVDGNAGERGRDQRDVFTAYSDNGGTTWSTPAMVNDDPALYDNWLPEVGVTSEGYAYTLYYDFHDATGNCGGSSHAYVARTLDGNSYQPSQRVSTVPTAWTFTGSNIAPNHGDYLGLYGGDVLALSWADGRAGDVDVWGATVQVLSTIACPNDTTVNANTTYTPTFTVNNPNVVFANAFNYSITVNRAWPGTPLTGSLNVPAGGSSPVGGGIAIPDTAADGDVELCFTITQDNGVVMGSCCVTLHVINPATGTLASLASASADDGRVRIQWQVRPSERVMVYRSVGAEVWDRLGARDADGSGRIDFEDANVTLGGRYGYRLGIMSGGREVTDGEIWLEVPATSQLALFGARPNPAPAVGGLQIAFSLARGGSARIELLDLSGRRVAVREVGSLGPGNHVISLNREIAKLPAGMYAIRLTQGGTQLNSKVAIVR